VYAARGVVAVADQTAAVQALTNLDPATTTIATGTQTHVEADPSATVTVVDGAEDRVTLAYTSATPNLLRTAIPVYPGWRATLDGRDLELVSVDAAFIGVVVPPGSGEVQLDFTPRWFWAGALLSGLGVLISVGLLSGGHAHARLLHA
jgi:arabinofuranan 3-O-arabinosyltransferase